MMLAMAEGPKDEHQQQLLDAAGDRGHHRAGHGGDSNVAVELGAPPLCSPSMLLPSAWRTTKGLRRKKKYHDLNANPSHR